MSMYEDLDSFFDNLSQTSTKDIVLWYRDALKAVIGDYFFIDEESGLFCALIKSGSKFLTLRLERENPKFNRNAFKKMKELLKRASKEGLPIEAHTHKDFWNKKVKQLLKILNFRNVEIVGDYYVAYYGEE